MEEQKEIDPKAWRLRSIISFAVFALFVGCVWATVRYIYTAPKAQQVSAPLRSAFAFNEKVAAKLYSPKALAPTYPSWMAAKKARANGKYGMGGSISQLGYSFALVQQRGTQPSEADTIRLTINDLRKFEKQQLVFNFKCIEGWSQITWWGGVRLADVLRHYKLGGADGQPIADGLEDNAYKYVGLTSQDGGYYVGIDMPSAMHPQTLLAWELNNNPLPAEQGAPLRLIIPTKYGVKNLKKIGSIFMANTKPRDYWAERGYDYDCGL